MHHSVEYASEYLVPGVSLPTGPSCHQISLRWDRRHPDAVGSFHIDPNSCGLDAFGDRTVCTRMAIADADMKLTQVAEKPGHIAYAIAVRARGTSDQFSVLPLHLVTIAAQGTAPARVRLLVLGTGQTVERIFELHAA
jgi:hypothetical protein